jgi:hypothetical protein
MALSLNPFTESLGSASSLISSASNAANSSLGGINFASTKDSLEGTVSRLSGGIGSALNGATAGLPNIGTALGGIGGIANAAGDIGASINKFGLGGALGSLGGIASQISSAAGQINNLLSMFRGQNLPSGAELFQAKGDVVPLQVGTADDWRVRIDANFELLGNSFQRLDETYGVVWPYTPKVSISTKANYSSPDVVHNNYPFMVYKNSQVDDITISGDFSCETERDAEYWIQATTFFKAATKMFFGNSNNAGNPPIICKLSGYGPGVFNQVPVIIKSFTMELPEDVNYIQCSISQFGPTWVPVMSSISVTVSPIYNRSRIRQFSLQDYSNGQALGYI